MVIYRSLKKGIQWDITAPKNYKRDIVSNWTFFYLLPTIEYSRMFFSFDEDDQNFDIHFEWLFWKISVSRYWGDVYKRR